ncbi:MAG TPA: NAD(P)-dependent oxidoreductase [Chloroflexota bacterium]|nr:NAD(P)-dependent oxidoreductase [Chloroflexota bacterium]
MQLTVIGLGRMGQAIAGRLLDKGHGVTVWNRTPGREAALVARGARPAPSTAAAVAGAEVVITSLSDDAAVLEVCLGEGGIVAALGEAAILVDMSTVSPRTSRQLAEAVPGSRFVDAPVLAGPQAIQAGQGQLLLGGPPDLVARLDPLWQDLTALRVRCGPTGSGSTMKLLSNLVLIGGIALLAEAVATGQAAGLPTEVIRQVFEQSPLLGPGLRNRLEDILTGDHSGWFSVSLAEKDVRLAVELGAAGGLTLALGPQVQELLARTAAAGRAEQDIGAVVEVIRTEGKGLRTESDGG